MPRTYQRVVRPGAGRGRVSAMVKRTTRPASPAVPAQPDPAPGSAMTEATPAPVVAEPTEAAQAMPVTGTPAASAAAAPATAAGAWPEVSTATAGPRCPWCSAPLASLELETCPSCGA